MSIFLTSNQQFGRPNSIKIYGREFNSVDEMNSHLIKQWNSVVSSDDSVYVLGNFAWDPATCEKMLEKLNGKIYFLDGEHDSAINDVLRVHGNAGLNHLTKVDSIYNFEELDVVMSYWPLGEWNNKKGSTMSCIGFPCREYSTNHKKKIINVSCDFWDHKPVCIDKLKDLFSEIKSK